MKIDKTFSANFVVRSIGKTKEICKVETVHGFSDAYRGLGKELTNHEQKTFESECFWFVGCGQSYAIGTSEAVQFVDATPESQVQEVLLALPKSLQSICFDVVSYTGTVTDDSLSSLGLYKLHGDSILCTSFIAHKVCIEAFKSKQPIIVYNAHFRIVDDTKYYIMCGGSYAVSQPRNTPGPKFSSTLHPLIDFVMKKGLGVDDFLWLTKIYFKLINLLDQMLKLGDGVYRKYVFEMFNYLIFDNSATSESSVTPHVLMKEFFLNEHKCAPLVSRKHPNLQILTIEDCKNWSTLKETGGKFWTYNVKLLLSSDEIDTKYAVIGRLNIEESAPCLTLSDGNLPIHCILVGASDCCSRIKSCIGKIVMVRQASVVMEQFRLPAGENDVNLKNNFYLLLSPRDIIPISDNLENYIDSSMNSQDNSTSLNVGKCLNGEASNVESDLLSQHLVIHHVSTPTIFYNEKQFFCLVSLLGHPVESSSLSNSITEKSNEKGRLCLLGMMKNMLKYYPFLFENRVYEIKYQSSYGLHLFDKRANLPALASAAVFLPFTNGVLLPNKCSISGPFTSPQLAGDTVMDKEIYRIRDAKNVEWGDVVHLQGVVILREHQPTRYPRKRKINEENYGVPLENNIILELKDEERNETIRIYLIAFVTKLYPLGLLPGSLVRIKFLEKKISGKMNHFYQSTCFTSIKVLDYPKGSPISTIESIESCKRHSYIGKERGDPNLLHSPFWGIFSISKIWKLEVLPVCRTCKSHIRYGRCSYVGCSNLSKDPKIMANANFMVEDGSGEAFLIAKDENVRKLLGFSESEWKDLGDAAAKSELLFEYKRNSDQLDKGTSKRTREDIDQTVFKNLGTEVELTPWHILCRKFASKGNEETLCLMCLDVQEIDLMRAESLSH